MCFLLSSSSSYSDLMPQFLRAIRALCNLYSLFRQTVQRSEVAWVTHGPHSLPTSPAITSTSDLPGVSVHRAGSFGSLLDGSPRTTHPRTQTVPAATNVVQPLTRRTHRRSHSQTLPPDETTRTLHPGEQPVQNGSCTTGGGGRGGGGGGGGGGKFVLDELFAGLEAVWSSLESWFDLILVEVEKTTRDPAAGSVEGGRHLLKKRMESFDGGNTTTKASRADTTLSAAELSRASESEGEERAAAVVGSQATPPTTGRRRSRVGLKLSAPQSNQVAAAIVKTTPVERRVAYLG